MMGIVINKQVTPQLAIKQLTAPAEDAVTLAEQKSYGRVDGTAEDTLIPILIRSATKRCEEFVRGGFVRRTWRQTEDAGTRFEPLIAGRFLFGQEFALEIKNIQVVSIQSVTFFNQSDVATVIPATDYRLDRPEQDEPGRVVFKLNTILPTNTRYFTQYEIDYTAGYADRAALDAIAPDIRLAIMSTTQLYYENREEIKGLSAQAKENLSTYRIIEID